MSYKRDTVSSWVPLLNKKNVGPCTPNLAWDAATGFGLGPRGVEAAAEPC